MTDFIDYFGVTNKSLPIQPDIHRPLSRFSSTDKPQTYEDCDIYQEVLDDFIDIMADDEVEVAVTGFGGNELFAIFRPEQTVTFQRPHSLHADRFSLPTVISSKARERYGQEIFAETEHRKPYIAHSYSIAMTKCFNTYIRRGIWPVSPFASPKLAYFMRHMPPKYLYKRRIFTAYLAATGYPPSIYNRTSNESYSSFFDYCMANEFDELWTECLEHSVLISHGYVTHADAEYNYAHRLDDTDLYGLWVYKFMELELCLRQKEFHMPSLL